MRSTKKNIFDYSFNIQFRGNKCDINTYEYITNDKCFFFVCFFYIGRSIFRSFLTVIFYTFIFVTDELHVDFFT